MRFLQLFYMKIFDCFFLLWYPKSWAGMFSGTLLLKLVKWLMVGIVFVQLTLNETRSKTMYWTRKMMWNLDISDIKKIVCSRGTIYKCLFAQAIPSISFCLLKQYHLKVFVCSSKSIYKCLFAQTIPATSIVNRFYNRQSLQNG